MPKDVMQPREFEPEWLERSLDRYYVAGLVLMVLLLLAFPLYRLREPHLRSQAATQQLQAYRTDGAQMFATNCAKCHGKDAAGGETAPTLHSKQFLGAITDAQISLLVSGGVTGSSMPAWSVDFGGPFTDQQIQELVAYLRSLEPNAPSIPDWRQSAKAK
jgi:mono/diheme cytochrome c family protein